MVDASAKISFITPAEKRQRLDQLATAFGKNLSAILNDAVDQYLALQEWQFAHIEQGVAAVKKGDFATDQETDEFFDRYGEP